MKTARKYLIPVFVAAFALMFAVATPLGMAYSGDGSSYHDGSKYHKHHWTVQVSNDFKGNIEITEDSTHESLKSKVTILQSDVESQYPDAKKVKLGIAENENGKYVVWKAIEYDMEQDSETKTKLIHVIDAGAKSIGVAATEDVEKEYDYSTKSKMHAKMKDHYAEMTPEEREKKRAQHMEMKEAFSSLSEEDQSVIKTHFHQMKKDGADMSEEDREAKFAKYKEEMHAFMQLSLDEKKSYLKYFAMSLKNQA